MKSRIRIEGGIRNRELIVVRSDKGTAMATFEITLEQLRNAILQLPEEQRRELLLEVERGPSTELARPDAARSHSILDIPPVSVGAVLRPLSSHDDLLEEMLEGRA